MAMANTQLRDRATNPPDRFAARPGRRAAKMTSGDLPCWRSSPLGKCIAALFALMLILLNGCRHAPPQPSIDLTAPGWRIWQGQATWKPGANRPELTGEILYATNRDREVFIQFAKDPFPLVVARTSESGWRIQFGPSQKAWSGRGKAPDYFLWFQLPRALAGAPPAQPWSFSNSETNWRLENLRRGEWLEGRFFP